MKLSKLFLGLLALFAFTFIFAVAGSVDTSAKPPGLRDSCIGKKIDNFNVLLRPNAWEEGGNGCNGSRIFFDNSGGPVGSITWLFDPTAHGVSITDCDGTDGSAEVVVDEGQNLIVAIRVVGPATSNLDLVCTVIQNDTVTGNEDLCIVDGVRNIQKGNNFTKITKNIADGEFEEVLYTIDNDEWKIFQVWLMEWDGTNCY
ncbi:MAG: hypothetical protein ACR2NW_07770 [Thermodesulfobacteriota bacterium]